MENNEIKNLSKSFGINAMDIMLDTYDRMDNNVTNGLPMILVLDKSKIEKENAESKVNAVIEKHKLNAVYE